MTLRVTLFRPRVTPYVTVRLDDGRMPLKDPDARRAYQRAYQRQWYRKNREVHLARVLRVSRRAREATQQAIDELKNCECVDCGGRFPPFLMDFDHVRGTKVANLAKMRSGRVAWAKIVEEVAKCEVVCANCHRRRTYLRRVGLELPAVDRFRLHPRWVSVVVPW